jgi:hypothetical protein
MNKRLIHILVFLLSVPLVCPLNLEASHLKLKLGLGFSSYGKVEDTWVMTTNFYDLHISSGEKTAMPLDVTIEIVYKFGPNFGLSFGTGYISKGISGTLGRFSFPKGSGPSGDFSSNPLIDSRLYPVYLSAIWSYPVMLEGEIYILGGLGYYFGRIKCLDAYLQYNLQESENQWGYFDWKYKSNFNSLGYHGGIGFEYEVSNKASLFIEAIYRIVNIRKFNSIHTDVEESRIFDILGDEIKGLAGKSTFLYAQRFGGEEAWGDIVYRITNLNYSGISLRLGFKFQF